MEPPQHMFLGGEEECHSSESGWTMYIGSPTNHHEDVGDDCYQVTHQVQGDAGIESDDSMVSDASSGPTHYGDPLRHFKKKVKEDAYDDDDHDDEVLDYYCYGHQKKGCYKKENQIGEKKQKVSVEGGGRKNQRVGTRK